MSGSISLMLGIPLASGGGGPSLAEYTYFPMYGQSLSLGVDPDGSSALSSPDADHKMFVTGVRVHYDTSGYPTANVNAPVDPDSMASLVTLAEQVNAIDSDYGETMASGIADKITGTTGIFATTARAGHNIAQLSKGADNTLASYNHYLNTCAAATHARLLSDAASKTFALGPLIWKQGEADGAANRTASQYKADLEALHEDLKLDLGHATLTDTTALKILTDQQAMQLAADTFEEIALAVLNAHRDGNGIICVGPAYQWTYTGVNDVHYLASDYRNCGELFGLAAKTVIEGGTWNPCHITGVSRSGTTITVNVHVPHPPLQVDTTIVATVANKGFEYSGATITDVSITDDGTGDNAGVITITIDSDAGGNLGYAWKNATADMRIGNLYGPRGNICDSSSEVSTYDSTPLYNWLCRDYWSVA